MKLFCINSYFNNEIMQPEHIWGRTARDAVKKFEKEYKQLGFEVCDVYEIDLICPAHDDFTVSADCHLVDRTEYR